MLPHDEVRERPALSIDVADKAQRHPGAGRALDTHDLGGKVERLLARKIEVELGG